MTFGIAAMRRHARQVLQRVEGQPAIERRPDPMRGDVVDVVAVAIGRRARRHLRAHHAAGAGPWVDDDGLAEFLAQPVLHHRTKMSDTPPAAPPMTKRIGLSGQAPWARTAGAASTARAAPARARRVVMRVSSGPQTGLGGEPRARWGRSGMGAGTLAPDAGRRPIPRGGRGFPGSRPRVGARPWNGTDGRVVRLRGTTRRARPVQRAASSILFTRSIARATARNPSRRPPATRPWLPVRRRSPRCCAAHRRGPGWPAPGAASRSARSARRRRCAARHRAEWSRPVSPRPVPAAPAPRPGHPRPGPAAPGRRARNRRCGCPCCRRRPRPARRAAPRRGPRCVRAAAGRSGNRRGRSGRVRPGSGSRAAWRRPGPRATEAREGDIPRVQQKIIDARVAALHMVGDPGVAAQPVGLGHLAPQPLGDLDPLTRRLVGWGEQPQRILHHVDAGAPVRRIDHEADAAAGCEHGYQRLQPGQRVRQVVQHATAIDVVEGAEPAGRQVEEGAFREYHVFERPGGDARAGNLAGGCRAIQPGDAAGAPGGGHLLRQHQGRVTRPPPAISAFSGWPAGRWAPKIQWSTSRKWLGLPTMRRLPSSRGSRCG